MRKPTSPMAVAALMVTLLAGTAAEVSEEDAELSDLAARDEVRIQPKAAEDATEFVARKISVETEEDQGKNAQGRAFIQDPALRASLCLS